MNKPHTFSTTNRDEWRQWLTANYQTADEVWQVYPRKHTGIPRLLHNDAVEEAVSCNYLDLTLYYA